VLTPGVFFGGGGFSRKRERKSIQGDSGGMVNISGVDSIGNYQKKKLISTCV